mgnify:CR=1 FL=1
MKINPIFRTTLDRDLPAGPQGQPAHKKGESVASASLIKTNKLGHFLMVTPNPIFFYLNFSEHLIEEFKNELLLINNSKKEWHMYKPTDTTPAEKFRNLDGDLLYSCIQKAIAIPIFLFTAIEAFVNQAIPEGYTYRTTNKKGFVIEFNKAEIERNLGTEEKLGIIMNEIHGKKLKQDSLWNYFMELKEMRNNLIHLKTRGKHMVVAYDSIYAELIDLDFDTFFKKTKEIMEFFIPDYFK